MMVLKSDPQVKQVFENYPTEVRSKMEFLKDIVIDVAKDLKIDLLEETLKWGEPSYKTKYGSTLRMDWKTKTPDQYALYFSCSTTLVSTFKAVFGEKFNYEGKRAIVFNLNDDIPLIELKECIKATLRYHQVKNLPSLGI